MASSKYKDLLNAFLLTQKGFNYIEIEMIVKNTEEEWKKFLILFFVIFINKKEIF